MIDLAVISNISNIQRFSGNFLFSSENIATHSLEMILLCINFSELVPESDRNEMCYRCAIHDLEESVSSDVPRPLKYANPKLRKLISDTSLSIMKNYVDEELLKDITVSKDKNNINGFLVGLADRIQCYFKISREVKHFGNKSLQSDLYNFDDALPEIFDSIKEYPYMSSNSKENLRKYLNTIINFY